MAGRREAEAVAEAGRGPGAERPRPQPLAAGAQRRRVLRRERPDQHARARVALEVAEGRAAGVPVRGHGEARLPGVPHERELAGPVLHLRGSDELQVQLAEACAHGTTFLGDRAGDAKHRSEGAYAVNRWSDQKDWPETASSRACTFDLTPPATGQYNSAGSPARKEVV